MFKNTCWTKTPKTATMTTSIDSREIPQLFGFTLLIDSCFETFGTGGGVLLESFVGFASSITRTGETTVALIVVGVGSGSMTWFTAARCSSGEALSGESTSSDPFTRLLLSSPASVERFDIAASYAVLSARDVESLFSDLLFCNGSKNSVAAPRCLKFHKHQASVSCLLLQTVRLSVRANCI